MPRLKLIRKTEADPKRELERGMPRTFARLADLYRREKKFDRAIELCRVGIEQFPGYGTGHIVLALTYIDMGEREAALIEFHSALKCMPDNLLALKSVADIHCEAEAFSLARSYYRQVLQRDRFNSEALDGSKRNSNQISEPDQEREEPAETGPKIDESELNHSERGMFNTVTLAELYKKQGHTKLAREICDSILKEDPENERVRDILEQLGS